MFSGTLMLSPTTQNYLTAIYRIGRATEFASTSSIAERLGVAAASVTGMLRRLAEQGLVERVPYGGGRLTESGEAEALRVIRRHRVLETYLVRALGYSWDRVHEEADRLEHTVSDELIEQMASAMGRPTTDPHGAPIPVAGAGFDEPRYPALDDLEPAAPAVLRRVSVTDPAMLRYLTALRIVPGVTLTLLERAPFDGPARVRVQRSWRRNGEGEEQLLGRALLRSLLVEPLASPLVESAATVSSAGGSDV